MAVSFADKFTVTPLRSERYSDFYIDFNKNYGTKDLARLTNEDSIISSIKNIIQTRKGERPFFPEFGSRVANLLFENFSGFETETLKTEIKTAIENFEPRAVVTKIDVFLRDDDHNVEVTLVFNTINNSEDISISFFLSRIR